METKYYCFLPIKDKNDFVINDSLNNQFNNLNLNQKSQNPYAFSESSKNISIKKKKFLNNDFTKNDTNKNSNSWNKTTKDLSLRKNDDYEKEDHHQNPSNNSSSTISLHIEAYEKIDKVLFHGTKEKEDLNHVIKNEKNAKQMLNASLSVIQNPFEFPRQQEKSRTKIPEISQFKVSQQLLNPNRMHQNSMNQANSQHKTMTAEVLESAIQVIDSCQNFMNGITTLETSTETTYELYKAEQEKSKKHFHQMRIELATQTSEIVNAVLRRMNDCALTIESYENRYNQVFEETTKEYNVKKDKMKDLKETCSNISDNNPQTEYIPHLADVSSKLSEEVSAFTNQMVLSLRELFHPPKLLSDIGSILNVLNDCTKFSIRGHVFSPVYRTDSTLNIIDVPILKLAENPITEIAGNQKPGEKRSGGPFFDAVAAKKSRNEMNGPSVAEIAGTKITHPTFENATLQNSLYSQVPSHLIHPSNISYADARTTERPTLPRPTIRMPSVAQGYNRRGAPVISFKNCGPISIVHQQQQPQQQSFKPIRPNTVRTVNRAVAPPPYNPPSYGIQVSPGFVQQQQGQINYGQNNSINQRLPAHLQIRPRPLTRVIHCPPRVNMMNNGNNIIRLPRVPVVPDLKKGSESMEKALMEVVKQPTHKMQKESSEAVSKEASKSTFENSSKVSKETSKPADKFPHPSTSNASTFLKSSKTTNESSQESNETSSNGNLRRSARLSKHK